MHFILICLLGRYVPVCGYVRQSAYVYMYALINNVIITEIHPLHCKTKLSYLCTVYAQIVEVVDNS